METILVSHSDADAEAACGTPVSAIAASHNSLIDTFDGISHVPEGARAASAQILRYMFLGCSLLQFATSWLPDHAVSACDACACSFCLPSFCGRCQAGGQASP